MLRALWRKVFSSAAAPGAAVPPELVEHARRFETAPLVAWLRTALERQADAPELPLLQNVVRQAGWQAHDVAKLAVAAAYGAGRWALAFEHAAPLLRDETCCDVEILVMTCDALYRLGRFEEAWRLIETIGGQGLELANRVEFALVAALIAQASDRMAVAKRWIDTARRLAPDDGAVAFNALTISFETGDEAAVAELEREIDAGRFPGASMEVARAVVELARDRYPEGFRFFEARYRLSDADRYLNGALFDRPRWQGEPLAGRVLLASAEQGLGDTIQMARYIPLLYEKGAGVVVVEAQAEAVPLLQASFPAVVVVERRMGAVPPAPTFDVWAGMMSLPHLFGTTAESVPARAGYLRVPEESAVYWRRRVAELAPNGRPRIGLCWSGRRTHRADRRRSLPSEMIFPYIEALPVVFFSLQKEVPASRPANLIDVADELVTLADTAALIEAMDLVVSIDSAPAHLGGALGKETWLLLPYRYEWRWGLTGETNRWYDAVKVFRQGCPGDWGVLLETIFARRLPAWLAERER